MSKADEKQASRLRYLLCLRFGIFLTFLKTCMPFYSRSLFAMASASMDDTPRGVGSKLALDYHYGWTSLWDPRVLAVLGFVPEFRRADSGGLDHEGSLIVCPDVMRDKLDTPLLERLSLNGSAVVMTACRSRSEIVQQLLQTIRGQASEEGVGVPVETEIPDDRCMLLDEFYAFAFMVMQVQVMARKLRYSFNLDWMIVGDQVIQAAKASVAGDLAETERWIAAAFDSLSQERDRYCSQQGNVLELVLTAATTVGSSLLQQLRVERPLSVFATTATLQRCRETNPAAWECLRERLLASTLSIAGGFREEPMHGYLVESSLHRSMQAGQMDFVAMGLEPPKTWMRFQPGITSATPEVAKLFGYHGAILTTPGGGAWPEKDHAKIRWQSHTDSPTLDCILGHVLDASDAEALLSVGAEMAKQLDYHQVPTLVLAHWPSKVSPLFQDFVLAMQRTPAIGKWIDVDRYFATTAQPYWTDAFTTQQFRVPLPETAVELHALHERIIATARRLHRLDRIESASRMWRLVPRVSPLSEGEGAIAIAGIDDGMHYEALRALQSECDRAMCSDGELEHHGLAGSEASSQEDGMTIDRRIDALHARLLEDLLTRVPAGTNAVAFNPASHAQRVFAQDIQGSVDVAGSPRLVVCGKSMGSLRKGEGGVRSDLVVDVPPFGFVPFQIEAGEGSNEGGSTAAGGGAARGKLGAEKVSWFSKMFGARGAVGQTDGTLANEFMEIQVDWTKGHMKSMYVANKRGNRLSGMISLVPRPLELSHKLGEASFAALQNVECRLDRNSKACGSIEVRGVVPYMHHGGEREAALCIRYTLWQGARWLDVEVEAEGLDPHACYPVWRMVWPSEAATLAVWQHGYRGKWPGPLQGMVELIEIDDAEHRLHFATGGLSLHRRMGPNHIVSALPVGRTGNSVSKFSIGMDWPRAWETAIDRIDVPWIGVRRGVAVGQGTGATGAWLAQSNMPNIRFQWMDPEPALTVAKEVRFATLGATEQGPQTKVTEASIAMVSDSGVSDAAVALGGHEREETVRADACWWLVETSGKSGVVRLSCVKNIQRGWRVDFRGYECDRLKAEGGELLVPYKAWERSRIAVCFGKP